MILIDIRNPGEAELGRIPGAVNIPLAQLRNRLGVADRQADRRALRGRLALQCGRLAVEGRGFR